MDGMLEIVKCKNKVIRKGIERECGSFLMKKVNNEIHLKCRGCDHYAVISVINGEMVIVHVDKKGEEEMSCQQRQ